MCSKYLHETKQEFKDNFKLVLTHFQKDHPLAPPNSYLLRKHFQEVEEPTANLIQMGAAWQKRIKFGIFSILYMWYYMKQKK